MALRFGMPVDGVLPDRNTLARPFSYSFMERPTVSDRIESVAQHGHEGC